MSAGIHGWPIDVAVQTVASTPTAAEDARFVLFNDEALATSGAPTPSSDMSTVPDRIALPHVGVVLRRYHDSDIDGLYAAIEENRDHLRPHMLWADESRHEFMAFATDAIAQWDRGDDRNYAIVDDADGRYLGGCGLHHRIGTAGREIGYWLVAAAPGRGIVTAAARAQTATALAMDAVSRVEIHCDEANVGSAAVARRLGFRLVRRDCTDLAGGHPNGSATGVPTRDAR